VILSPCGRSRFVEPEMKSPPGGRFKTFRFDLPNGHGKPRPCRAGRCSPFGYGARAAAAKEDE
jgi:hypothetical protein